MRPETELAELHKKSRLNRAWLAKSKICGCFYCFAEFPFDHITKWIEGGETAMCPRCGIDSVLDSDTEVAEQSLLHEMHERWFKTAVRLKPGDAWAPQAKPK